MRFRRSCQVRWRTSRARGSRPGVVRLEAEHNGAIVSADPHISHLAKIPPGLNGSALALPSVEGATSRPATWPTSTRESAPNAPGGSDLERRGESRAGHVLYRFGSLALANCPGITAFRSGPKPEHFRRSARPDRRITSAQERGGLGAATSYLSLPSAPSRWSRNAPDRLGRRGAGLSPNAREYRPGASPQCAGR